MRSGSKLFPGLAHAAGSWHVYDGEWLVAVLGDWKALDAVIPNGCSRYWWQWVPA